MALHHNLPAILLSITLILGMASSVSVSSRLQPSPSPMSTPFRNDHPVIYMNAFYDPKYHSGSSINMLGSDEGRTSKTLPTGTTKIKKQSTTPTARTFTLEEKFAILQKYQMLQNAKFKRGIANSVDFTGDGDSLAVETRDSLAMESDNGSPKIVVKPKKSSPPSGSIVGKQIRSNKDQIQSESKKKVKPEIKPGFNPHQAQSYYDNHSGSHNGQGVGVLRGYVNQANDELVHGRRKMRAHYFRQHKTPSLGKAWVEMRSKIGYW